MKPIKLSGRNIMFTEPMDKSYDLNTGLIRGNKFNFVIDTGIGSGSVAPVLSCLSEDKKPVVVINTHFHWDHVWGNWMFAGSAIIAHVKCRELIDKSWDESFKKYGGFIDGEARKLLPNLVFEDGLYFPDDGVRIFYTPGHSESCISVFDETEKILYAGDNIGDTDDEIIPHIGTDGKTFKKTIEIYKGVPFDICVSGHNKPQGKDVTARMEAALDAAWERQNRK